MTDNKIIMRSLCTFGIALFSLLAFAGCRKARCANNLVEVADLCRPALLQLEIRTSAGDIIDFKPSKVSYDIDLAWLLSSADLVAVASDPLAKVSLSENDGPEIEILPTASYTLIVPPTADIRKLSIQVENDSDLKNEYTIDLRRIPLSESSYIKGSNTDSGDTFGSSIALSQDILAIGAPNEDGDGISLTSNDLEQSGATYVFERNQDGLWLESSYLKAANADDDDNFGSQVDLFENTLVVSAPDESSDGSTPLNNDRNGSGAVYVFERSQNAEWSQTAYLKASNLDSLDHFGSGVSLSDGILAIAADSEASDGSTPTNNDANQSGAVYIFEYTELGEWTETTYIKASNAGSADFFGDATALDNGVLVIGAPFEDGNGTTPDNNDNDNSGAVYVVERMGDMWTETAYIKASNADADDTFGRDVAIDGDVLVVGAPQEDSVGVDPENNDAPESGAVYVFERGELGNWVEKAYLKPSNSEPGDRFGQEVAIQGNLLIASARNEDSDGSSSNNNDASNSGAVYFFERDNNGDWVETRYLKASNASNGDFFSTIAIDSSMVSIGAFSEDSDLRGVFSDTDGIGNELSFNSGAVYVFR